MAEIRALRSKKELLCQEAVCTVPKRLLRMLWEGPRLRTLQMAIKLPPMRKVSLDSPRPVLMPFWRGWWELYPP